jgi:hypothetical protein
VLVPEGQAASLEYLMTFSNLENVVFKTDNSTEDKPSVSFFVGGGRWPTWSMPKFVLYPVTPEVPISDIITALSPEDKLFWKILVLPQIELILA